MGSCTGQAPYLHVLREVATSAFQAWANRSWPYRIYRQKLGSSFSVSVVSVVCSPAMLGSCLLHGKLFWCQHDECQAAALSLHVLHVGMSICSRRSAHFFAAEVVLDCPQDKLCYYCLLLQLL